MNLLVFTDLDGSLMEHETYSIEPAEPVLQQLRERGFLTVLNSSKTAAEMRAIQQRLDLEAPFVCENGAALYLDPDPDGQAPTVFGAPCSDWLPGVQALREQTGMDFEGFADWSAKQISDITGLTLDEAELARQREFSEPILWRGAASMRSRFEAELDGMGLTMLEGGRFLSIQGHHDKSNAMVWLREQQAGNDAVITVALGDSPNDSAMLEAADIAVIIKSGKSERIELHKPDKIIRTSRPGPAGWKDALTEILGLLDSDGLADLGR